MESSGETPGVALQPAGFWIRAVARILDQVVLAAVGFVVAAIAAIVAYATEDATGRSGAEVLQAMEKTTFISWIGNFAATVVYHALFESVAGSTVGKRLFGLQVISMDGTPIHFGQGVRRSVWFLVDALFFGAIAASAMNDSPEKQRLGDRRAGTRVVRRRSLPIASHPPTLQFFAAFVSAAQTVALILAVVTVLELWRTGV